MALGARLQLEGVIAIIGALWPVRVDGWGPQQEAEGGGRGRAETDEVRTLDLEMRWTGMRPRTTGTAGRSAARLRNTRRGPDGDFTKGTSQSVFCGASLKHQGPGCLHAHPCSAAD